MGTEILIHELRQAAQAGQPTKNSIVCPTYRKAFFPLFTAQSMLQLTSPSNFCETEQCILQVFKIVHTCLRPKFDTLTLFGHQFDTHRSPWQGPPKTELTNIDSKPNGESGRLAGREFRKHSVTS